MEKTTVVRTYLIAAIVLLLIVGCAVAALRQIREVEQQSPSEHGCDECLPGESCVSYEVLVGQRHACVKSCESDGDCREDQFCNCGPSSRTGCRKGMGHAPINVCLQR